MPDFSVHLGSGIADADVIAVYESVGWTAYTGEPDVLVRAIRKSAFVVTCRDGAGDIVGPARAISDDATICYVQDILEIQACPADGTHHRQRTRAARLLPGPWIHRRL